MITRLQEILSKAAKYEAGRVGNYTMSRYLTRGVTPSVDDYPTIVAACAKDNGHTYISRAKHTRREHVHQQLRDMLEFTLGAKIGTKSKYANNSKVGWCAEPNAVNKLLKHERVKDFNDVYFGDAYRPRTGTVEPPCGNCRKAFKNVIVR